MAIISQTNITDKFRRIILVNMEYFLRETRSQFICSSKFNGNDVRTDSVQAFEYLMSILYRHYVGHGSYLLHRKVAVHLSHIRNLTLTYFL